MGTGRAGVLIDAGLPGGMLEDRLLAAGIDPISVMAVVVTHEHRDHASGAGVWARRFSTPVYVAAGVDGAIEETLGPSALRKVDVRLFEPGGFFEVAGLGFKPFATSHDSVGSVGFSVTDGVSRFGFATDLGRADETVVKALKDADALVIESNHDAVMLENGPYPAFLKKRIRSASGHLSNDESAELLKRVMGPGLKAVVLAHLSEKNNLPAHAFRVASAVLGEAGAGDEVKLLVARQDRHGTVIDF